MIHGHGGRMPKRLAGQMIVPCLFYIDIVRAQLHLSNKEKMILQ